MISEAGLYHRSSNRTISIENWCCGSSATARSAWSFWRARHRFGFFSRTHTRDESKASSPRRFAGALKIRPRWRTMKIAQAFKPGLTMKMRN